MPSGCNLRETAAILRSLYKRFSRDRVLALFKKNPETARAMVRVEREALKRESSEHRERLARLGKSWYRELAGMSQLFKLEIWRAGLWQRGVYRRKCGRCRRSFFCTRPHGRFCSPACRSKARTIRLRQERRDRRRTYCRQCFEPFKATRGDARFCSPACRVAHHREISKIQSIAPFTGAASFKQRSRRAA
jgi:hypothetical protein